MEITSGSHGDGDRTGGGAMNLFFMVHREGYRANVSNALKDYVTVIPLISPPSEHFRKSKARIIVSIIVRQLVHTAQYLRLAIRSPKPVVFVTSVEHYALLLTARICSLLGIKVTVYLFNLYLHELGTYWIVQRTLGFLLGKNVGVTVQSPNEVEYFRSLDSQTFVRYYPYCFKPQPWMQDLPVGRDGYAFAGGYTNRDYDLLMSAARKLGHVQFVIACAEANKITGPIPENVKVVRSLETHEFHRMMARSDIVILPLKDNVGSSGQMVALAAMYFGKVVVYADYPTVSQYLEDGLSGLAYRPGDVQSLCSAIERACGSPDLEHTLGVSARNRCVNDFSIHAFESALTGHIVDFLRLSPGVAGATVRR